MSRTNQSLSAEAASAHRGNGGTERTRYPTCDPSIQQVRLRRRGALPSSTSASGPQDGVDVILDVMDELVHRRRRTDVHATLLGFGDCLDELRRCSTALGLDDWVTFTGRADKAMIADHLSLADVGLCPDLKTPLNDLSTMNKTMEYMAYALPAVAFDPWRHGCRVATPVLYVASGDVTAFADAVERLLDDPALRPTMALRARARVSQDSGLASTSECIVSRP